MSSVCYFLFFFCPFCAFLFCLRCGCVLVLSLPKRVSVVQITFNSHVRSLIEVITFTLCFYPLVCPCNPHCLEQIARSP